MKIIVAIAALTLSACTSIPKEADLAQTPPSRLFAFQDSSPSLANVHVLRSSSFVGGGTRLKLLIDSKEAAQVANGEILTVHIPAGEHIIEIQPNHPLLQKPGASVTLIAAAGTDYYFRINVDKAIQLSRTTAEGAGAP